MILYRNYLKFRVMFCNSLGCNSNRIPWSHPEAPGEKDDDDDNVESTDDEEDYYYDDFEDAQVEELEAEQEFRVPRKNQRLVSFS